MQKLVEDIQVGDTVEKEGKAFLITDTYESNGEGVGFITTNEKGKEHKFSATCGTYLTVRKQEQGRVE